MIALSTLGLDDNSGSFFFDEKQMVQAVALMAWPEEARSDPATAAAAAAGALARWMALGLPVRDSAGVRLFDIGHVVNFMRQSGLDQRDSVYSKTVAIQRRNTAALMTLPPPADGPNLHTPRRFRLALRRTFHLREQEIGKTVRLRLPLPYDDPSQRDMTVAITGLPAEDAVGKRFPNYFEVVMKAPVDLAPVSLEAEIGVTIFQQRGGVHDAETHALSEAERELYLRRQEGLIRVTPAIARLAAELAQGCGDTDSALAAFWRFSFARLKLGYLNHSALDAADPLRDIIRRGWSDCLGVASLFVALCRARHIPARLVQGLMLYALTPSFHFWAEIHHSDGWRPVDFSCWDHAAGQIDCEPWSRLFLGNLEYRLKCQRFPRLAVGPTGVRFPANWSWLSRFVPGGADTSFYDAATTRPFLSDTIRVAVEG